MASGITSNLTNAFKNYAFRSTLGGRNNILSGQQFQNPLQTGASRVIRDRYSENLCYGGTPISGGDAVGYPASNAFDGGLSNYWAGLQTGTGVSGITYLGYKFSVPKQIRKISLLNTQAVGTYSLQASADGVSWTAIASIAPLINAVSNSFQNFYIPASQAYLYWRLLATSNLATSNYDAIYELQMFECANTAQGDNDIVVQGNSLLNFANGFDPIGKSAVDYVEAIAADVAPAVTLPASDVNTVPLAYTDDLCNGGTAISGGDWSTNVAANAFDNNVTTAWTSSQATANQLGVSFIGYNFGVAKAIRKILLNQNINTASAITSAQIQYSANGTTWTTANTLNTLGVGSYSIGIPAVGAYQYWRILANANLTTGSGWGVLEIEMYESLQTHYLYADRNPLTKAITFGSTKLKPRTDKSLDLFSNTLRYDQYTDNLCVGGAAISSGDYANANAKENAFDGNISTSWTSAINTGTWVGLAIGYDFGVARQIRKLIFNGTLTTSIKIQSSSDNATWTDVLTATGSTGTQIYYLSVSSASRYWRIYANSNIRADGSTYATNAGLWVSEITMHELATDLHMYDNVLGTMNYFNGSAWNAVQRLFLGEADLNSAGQIVAVRNYDQGLLKYLKVEDLRVAVPSLGDHPVRLDQFLGSLAGNGYIKIPVSGFSFPLIIQWIKGASASANCSGQNISFPIVFPNICLRCIVGTYIETGGGTVGTPMWLDNGFNKSIITTYLYAGASNATVVSPEILAIGY